MVERLATSTPLFAERFGDTLFVHRQAENIGVTIERTAMQRLLADMDRPGYETAGFLLGRMENGKAHFTKYIPQKNITRRQYCVSAKNEVWESQVREFAAAGFDAIIPVHLHPEENQIVSLNYFPAQHYINSNDKKFMIWFGSLARSFGFVAFGGILTRTGASNSRHLIADRERAAVLWLFDSNESKPIESGFGLSGTAEELGAAERLHNCLRINTQTALVAIGYVMRKDIAVPMEPATPQ